MSTPVPPAAVPATTPAARSEGDCSRSRARSRLRAATLLARGPRSDGDPYAASSPPIYQTATFSQPGPRGGGVYDYSRSGNPTRDRLEEQLAQLEGAARALTYASGIAAVTAAVRTVAAGGEVVAGDNLYGGSYRLLSEVLAPQGLTVRYADLTDPAALAAVLSPRTRLVLAESPTNPTLRIADLRAIAAAAHAVGALLAVDGSLATPLLQRPLELGADLVIHSATKALSGHGDLTAGVIATDDLALADRLAFARNAEGTALAPFEAWLLLRGLRTLALRVERQEANARRVAEALAGHPAITRLHAPSLASHRGHELHRSQASGFGPVISFETGELARSVAVIEQLKLFSVAVSFGGVASSVSLPCSMSHASIPLAVRRQWELAEDLVRLSIGIEDPDDLIEDLLKALEEVGPAAKATGIAVDLALAETVALD
jgi:cysteine-S-conjugate beta-lyase